MVIVNIVGAPCVGKSTCACELFVNLKKNHVNTEYVSEFAKMLIWENREEDVNDQYYVAKNQYRMIKNVKEKVEIVICDSPMFISLFYNEYNKDNVSNVQKTRQYILQKMEEFKEESVYIFLKRNRELPYSTIGRLHDQNQSNEIEEKMEKMLQEYNIKYTTFIVGKDNIQEILDIIN